MNTDLLTLSEFLLEPSGAASRRIGEGHTLTLGLELMPVHHAFGAAMNGTVSVDACGDDTVPSLCASVIPAHDPGLTITF